MALAVATLLGTLFTVQAYLTAGTEGDFPVLRAFVVQSTQWWVWALLVPIIFAALDRWGSLDRRPVSVVAIHLSFAVLAAVLHAAGTASLLRAGGLFWTETTVPAMVRESLVLRFLSNLVTFGLIAAIYHVMRHIEALRASRERIRRFERRRADAARSLAGAVAHELSNRLTVVTNLWEMLLQDLDDLREPTEATREGIEQVGASLVEMRDVIRHISAIGMDDTLIRARPEEVSDVLEVVVEGMKAGDGDGIRPDLPEGVESTRVEVDLESLTRVVEALRKFLGSAASGTGPRVTVRHVEGTPSEADDWPDHRGGLVEIGFNWSATRDLAETTFDPHLVESDGTVRSTLELTAAQATVLRMGGDLSARPGGFRLRLRSVA